MFLSIVAALGFLFVLCLVLGYTRLFEKLFPSHIVFDVETLKKIVEQSRVEFPDGSLDGCPASPAIDRTKDRVANVHPLEPQAHPEFGLIEKRMDFIVKKLKERYPKHIFPWEKEAFKTSPVGQNNGWVHVMTGGAVGQMKLLHVSLSEYILLFGTPTGATGFSGLYLMDVFDFYFSGFTRSYKAGSLYGDTYKPYTVSKLERFTSTVYRSEPYTYMIEYGRGFPGVILGACYPFLAHANSTLDYIGFVKQVYFAAKSVLYELFVNHKM